MTQEIFYQVYRNLANFEGKSQFYTWLYRIALNHCSNLRSSWHARNVHTQEDESVIEQAAGASASPFRDVEMSELGRRIQRALDGLQEEYRILLLLVADQELSYDEIADVLNTTRAAVKSLLFRAREEFRQVYAKVERQPTRAEQ